MKPYKLLCTLYAHTGDVKGLCATKDGFVSVSRDLSAKIWSYNNENQYVEINCIKSHKKYVNAVTVVYSISEYPDGLVITGSNDQSICIFDVKTNSVIAQLVEHTGAVCTLNNTQTNLLYSGSFDSTAKIWNLADLVKSNFNLKSMITLKGHTHTVWSVLAIPQHGICLTGSADKLIKQWKAGECVHTYRGHTDCVRGLAISKNSKDSFFSCSNDGTVIQWTINNPQQMKRFNITESFLYSIFILNDTNVFVTGGEDRSLRLNDSTKSDSLLQTIVLPCQSLWNSICLPNNDIVIACSDGTIRIFTQDETRVASQTELEAFDRELSAFAIPTKTDETMSQINRNELPGIEALSKYGKRDGQTIMINNENEIEVYSWSDAESRWIKIGVAVGSATSAGGTSTNRDKTVYEGKEYDYVFDISLDDEGSSLKLPYNLSEDPWFVAQKFIHKHELNQIFLDQIAHFIINNTKGETITAQSSSYHDPFTGESRYTPGGSNSVNDNLSNYYDPFTGQSRYAPATNNSTISSTNGTLQDPFTGGNAYRSSASAKQLTSHVNEYFPQTSFVLFEQKNIPTIINKIKELQSKNKIESGAIEKLESLTSSTSYSLDSEFQTFILLLNNWTQDSIFPIIDLFRISSIQNNVQKFITINCLEILDILLSKIDSSNATNTMLVLRIFCNLFTAYENKHNEIIKYLVDNRVNILNKVTKCYSNGTPNKNFQISFATLVLNYAVLFNKFSSDNKYSSDELESIKTELLHYISGELLNSSILDWDSEAIFRLLVCIGTIVCDNSYLTTMAKSIVDLKQFCLKLEIQQEKNLPKVNGCIKHLKNIFC